ncbi:MAG: redoxin [bacterium (Candidatus Stahlbacteria) CG08_land_8_20_14_0_20_40_26]|nr:MAG: redoxin [bacterium (Candidatus Stahlbacteria) CG23_combo_of_CG06-09_8_20_14_all_40_9]PIS23555.1 MAG: redoxin [bacterium (Candidatus Stahlbacteria) CG08_land_8_20_14_0_20_40_26]
MLFKTIRGYMWRMVIPVFLLLACSNSKEKPKEKGEIKKKSTFIEVADFTLSTLDGDTMALSDFKGKVIILDFWATWCAPCRVEIPGFVELQREYGEMDLQILGVSLDGGRKEGIVEFCERYYVNYPILMDNGEVARKFGVTAIPTTYIIDRDGNFVKKYVGARGKEVFKSDIEELLR